jgi:putative solute:sodium symporter small subunit
MAKHRAYWRSNLILVGVLLVLWALPSLGAGILFVDFLDQWKMGGFPLGFWFAQQGSILFFVVLVLVYCLLMDKLDVRKDAGEEKPE